MKITEHKELEINDIAGDFNTIEADIDENSKGFLFEMMSKNLYSNPIGSIVREITSNCFDSHKEAKVDDAVVVNKYSDEEGDYISFQDFGVGLSPDRMKNIYMKYFSSTKRDTNDQIGGFGLGSKTPLSYTDSFYIITNFNNVKYQYLFSRGETRPTLDLMDESPTNERNGTEIKIYFKEIKDEDNFRGELKTQLCYFDNVYFNNWGIENDYKIYETDNFKYRSIDQYSNEMHIVLGKVSYPINWQEIGASLIKIPVAVKFEIGEIQVTPNREQIRYTEETKELLKERISKCVRELLSMYREDTMLYNNLREYLANKDSRPYIVIDENKDNKIKIYLTGLKEKKAVFKPLYDLGIDYNPDSMSYQFSMIYKSVGVISSVNKISSKTSIKNVYDRYLKEFEILVSENKNFVSIRNLKFLNKEVFVKSKFNRAFVREVGNHVVHRGVGGYFNLGLTMRAYKLYKLIESIVESVSISYECELTDEDNQKYKGYLYERNKKNIQRKENNKFPVNDIGLSCTSTSNYKYDLSYNELEKYTGFIVYGFIEHEEKLKSLSVGLSRLANLKLKDSVKGPTGSLLYKGCLNPKAVKIIRIGKNNEKYFKKENMVHVDYFNSNNRIFRKLATIYKIEKILIDLSINQSGYKDNFLVQYFRNINKDLADNLEKLYDYRKNNLFIESNGKNLTSKYYKLFKEEILNIAETNNWFDTNIINEINYVINWFNGVEIIKFTDFTEESLPFILKYLYDNKKKINLEYYMKYVSPVNLGVQLEMDFEPKEEPTKLFKILKHAA